MPAPVCEFHFHPIRRWAFDYAWPNAKIAIEQDGGVWIAGRHSRGSGFIKDAEKLNQAALEGWIVLRYTPQQIKACDWITDFRRAYGIRAVEQSP